MQLWRRLLGRGASTGNVTVRTDARDPVAAEVSAAVPAPMAPGRAAPEPAISGRKPGQLLGGVYPVVRSLGRGGFGEVFLCRHPEWDIEVAVKVPNAEALADPRTLSDLQREAEEWTGLGLHPNIAYCYHLHPIGNLPLLVVEFVSGGTLRQRIEGTEAVHDLRGNLDLAIQLCHALEHAHGRGLIHRDVTPENILIAADGTAKLTDFGIAKRGMLAGESGIAAAGVQSSFIGRRGYMAPEQTRKGAPIDARADLFGLGACLYELFCFCLPYPITEGPRQAPVDPLTLRQQGVLPERLVQLLTRLVAWEPEGRPASAKAVRAELAAIYRTTFGKESGYAELPELELTAAGHNNRGVSYHFLGKHAEAEAAFKEALAADPLHAEATYNLGLIRWRKAEITDQQLVMQLEQLRSAAPGWRPAYLLGLVHLERRDKEAAVKALEEACAEAPNEPSAKAALAQARAMLDNQAMRQIRTFEVQTSDVRPVALSPDLRHALSGSFDEILFLLEMATGRYPNGFKGHTKAVLCVALSPDGLLALSGSGDATLRLWEVTSGRCLLSLEGHTDAVTSVAFSPDGRLALSGSKDRTLRLWEVASGSCLRTFDGHTEWVLSVAFSSDGRQILSGSLDKSLRLWEVTSGRCLLSLEGHTDAVTSVAFSPDGGLALSGSEDKTPRLWDVASGRCLRGFEGHAGWTRSVAFSPDGRHALSGGADNTLRLWEVASGRCLRSFEGHTGMVFEVAFSPDGRQALSRSNDKTLRLWAMSQPGMDWHDRSPLVVARPEPLRSILGAAAGRSELLAAAEAAATGGRVADALRTLAELEAIPGQRRHAQVVKLRRRLAAQCRRGALRATWRVGMLSGHTGLVTSVAFSPDGRQVLSGSYDGTLRVWEVATGRSLRSFEGHTDKVTSVGFSPDGRQVLSGSYDGTLRLWELASGRCLRSFSTDDGIQNSVCSVAFSPDGGQVLSSNFTRGLLWEVATGRCLRPFWGLGNPGNVMAFSPDGRQVLSGSYGETMRLWEVATGRCLRRFEGHTSDATSVAFSPDGRQALSGSYDKTMRLWEVATGRCLRRFEGHTGTVIWVAFSPGGRQALSGGAEGALRVWETNTSECISVLRPDASYTTSVALSPDTTFIAGAQESSIVIWHLDWELLAPAGDSVARVQPQAAPLTAELAERELLAQQVGNIAKVEAVSDQTLEGVPMSPALQQALTRAWGYACQQGHGELTLEHLLLALSEDKDAARVLEICRVELSRLRHDVASHLGSEIERGSLSSSQPKFASGLIRILKYAMLAAQQGRRPHIDGAIVLAAIVGEGLSMSAKFLRTQGLTFEAAIKALRQLPVSTPEKPPTPPSDPTELPPDAVVTPVDSEATRVVARLSSQEIRAMLVDQLNVLDRLSELPRAEPKPQAVTRLPAHTAAPSTATSAMPQRAATPRNITPAKVSEPSMEEILASIRKIVAEG